MNNTENTEKYLNKNYSFDLYSTVKDILRNWFTIMLVGIIGALGCFVYAVETYEPQYYTSITMLVQSKTDDDSASKNGLAEIMKTVIASEQLQDTVAKSFGYNEFPGTLTCSVVEETNILSFTVMSDSPMKSYRLLNAVLDTYPIFTKAVASNVVLQTLEAPVVPVAPANNSNGIRMMFMGFVVGCIATAALTAVASYFKDTVKKEDDIEKKLNVKRIVSVPRQKKKLKVREKIKGVKKSLSIANPVIGFEFKETFRKIKRTIITDAENHGHKLFTVISSLENEGKTTVAVNIAISLAKSHRKVLLIDADLRKPAVTKFLEMSIEEGESLTDFLTGDTRLSNIIHYNELLNLSIIGCSKGTSRANELVAKEEMRYLLATARDNYDYVVIDTPPLGFTSDAEDILTEVDATVLVVRRDCATAITVNDTIDIITNTGSKILGCVYNDAEITNLTGSALAYNRYGYGGYGYGYKKYTNSENGGVKGL